MDGRKNNKGNKGNKGGRPKRIEEVRMFEMMDAIAAPEEAWQALWIAAQKDTNALKLWLAYRAGQPSNKVELSGKDGTDIIVNIIPPDSI